MGPSCLLRIFRIGPARKSSLFPLLTKLGRINMPYIGQLILLIVSSVAQPGEGPGGPAPPYC